MILKESAFASERALRFAFFHELVHAMNIPGWQYKVPVKLPYLGRFELTSGQTDLSYLEEYRWFTTKEGLWSFGSYTFSFFAAVFLSIFAGLLFLFRRG